MFAVDTETGNTSLSAFLNSNYCGQDNSSCDAALTFNGGDASIVTATGSGVSTRNQIRDYIGSKIVAYIDNLAANTPAAPTESNAACSANVSIAGPWICRNPLFTCTTTDTSWTPRVVQPDSYLRSGVWEKSFSSITAEANSTVGLNITATRAACWGRPAYSIGFIKA